MKKLSSFILFAIVTLTMAFGVNKIQAADENARPDGNGIFSMTGVSRVSTATASNFGGLNETRNVKTTNNGILLTFGNVVWRSSMVTVVSSTAEFVVDWDNRADSGTATSTVFSTRNINSNVFDICYASAPCYYKGFIIGKIETAQRVRVWDNRGSTQSSPLFDVTFDTTTGMGATVNFSQWFSSGINIHTDRIAGDVSSDPQFFHQWQPTVLDRHKQGGILP